MKSLETLLKVAQRRLDDLGVEAAKLQTRIEDMHQEIARIDAREAAETGLAAGDPMAMGMLAAFRSRLKMARGEVRGRIGEAEKTMQLVRDRLSEAYREKSKFKEMLEQAQQRQETARLAREQAQLDEAALNLSIRAG